jgi:hypothetical protein
VKKITKTARQILTALGQYPDEKRLLGAWVDEEGAHFAIKKGTITPRPEQVSGFLGEPDGTVLRIEFDEDNQTAEFTIE